MKTRYTVALAMLAGAAIGGSVIQGLHAQATPPTYFVADISAVTDPEAVKATFKDNTMTTTGSKVQTPEVAFVRYWTILLKKDFEGDPFILLSSTRSQSEMKEVANEAIFKYRYGKFGITSPINSTAKA